MQSTIAHLVIATMLVHSMLGCCVHHTHGDAGEALQSATVVMRSPGHTHCSEQCSSHDMPVEHGGRSCQADPCVFVRQTAGSTSQELRNQLAVHTGEPGGPGVLPAPVPRQAHLATARFPEHVRSHLAKCLLRI